MPTADDYRTAFNLERRSVYPCVDAFEEASGYALERSKLEAAARVLACPVKKNPPCWAHGRILYAATRIRLHGIAGPVNLFEIGTAKGFGALCLMWAMLDANHAGTVTSVDVIDPDERIKRNTVAELDGLLTLGETILPFVTHRAVSDLRQEIDFQQSTGIDYLNAHEERIHVAFVDGKHSGAVVSQEGWLLSNRQVAGDVALFDDVHLPDVDRAVKGLAKVYELERFDLLPNRALMLAVRK
jgi:hypothetical protein